MDYNVTYREKDKGIQVIISYKDHYGKWKQKSKQGFKKKGEAKKYADKMLDELKEKYTSSLSTEYEAITFGEYIKMYINGAEIHKEQNTITSYKTCAKKFNKLNDIELDKITSVHVQDCVNDMIKSGLSSNSIKDYLTKINIAFNKAVYHYKIISASPVANIEIPEQKKDIKIKALTKAELDDLLSKIKKKKFYMISLLAANCGLRFGEILGLTWNDLDEVNSMLKINKQWKQLKDGKIGFGPLKTKTSYRDVPVPSNTLKELLEYQKTTPTDINNRIISNGTIHQNTSLLYVYKKIGYNISVHDLRHTYATFLIGNGVDFKTAAQLLGHSVDMTMKIYSHVNNDMLDKAKNKINSIF